MKVDACTRSFAGLEINIGTAGDTLSEPSRASRIAAPRNADFIAVVAVHSDQRRFLKNCPLHTRRRVPALRDDFMSANQILGDPSSMETWPSSLPVPVPAKPTDASSNRNPSTCISTVQ